MPRQPSPFRRRHSLRAEIVFFVAEWAAMMAGWMLLVDTTAKAEVWLGLGVGLLAAATATWLHAANFARFAPHAGELLQAWRLPWYLIADTAGIFVFLGQRLLGRRPRSSVRTVGFDVGGDDPHSAARRALAIALSTIPPNCVVIGIDRDRRQLVFHQLRRGSVSLMTQKLGARP